MKHFIIIFVFNIFIASTVIAANQDSRELRCEHFIVNYSSSIDESYARSVGDIAETYYRDITQEFNLIRDNLWLWDNRAKIYIAKDKSEYCDKFKCPSWSGACVDYENKIIYTYPNQDKREAIFSHELTHIIFREYVGKGKLPLWLDEAAATYIEDKHSGGYQRSLYILRNAITNNQYVKFSQLEQMNLSGADAVSQGSVNLFYIESFSIVFFLIKRYGRDNFYQFLYFLRNGYEFGEAMRKGFTSIKNIDDLEDQWKRFYLE
ncbi:MAG: hypothetical protein PHQ96_01560 [Candidatus Omnitrophica bacterium]|nr:hypothetical protein [Candidatus Omnitrophota bacterium]